jgi:pyridoxamine 5'-phosphate oxidase-like protein
MESLPDWDDGTVAILATGAGAPHAIPVSTCVRAGPRTVLLALACGRESLARLREDPRCALSILARGDVAVTVHARATILQELTEAVMAVRLDVERLQDHGQPTFEIEDGVRWRWLDPEARERDTQVREALRALSST